MKNVIAAKAYRNEKFLASEGARNIRILCECTESQQRLAEHGVTATILFFGSARAKSKENHASLVADVEAKLAVARAEQNATDISSFELKADALARSKWMSEYFDKVQELSKKVTEWSVNPNVSLGPDCKVTGVTRYHETNTASATAATTSATTTTSDNIIDEESVDIEDTGGLSVRQAIVVVTGGGKMMFVYSNCLVFYYIYVVNMLRYTLTT